MCTVTWVIEDGGYGMVLHREARCSRREADAPRARLTGDVAVVSPHDPNGGGTWIFCNAHGLSACVLHDDDQSIAASPPANIRETHGRLLGALGHAPDTDALEA